MKLLDQLVDERAEIGTAMAAVCDAAAEETRDLSETCLLYTSDAADE